MTTPEGSNVSVLIADDDPLVRRVLRMALESQGYDVHEAGDVQEVIAQAEQRHDLVVLDINMPGGTVRDTLGGLRNVHPDLPILVLSGEATPPDDLPAIRADYARKPIDLDDLLSRVRRLLEGSVIAPP
ncbi:response regulator [Microcella sp.]|uniref:response regulator n=1 Tax=Microcella sp. TaxID=1913979 RepID=UPI0025668E38|nr:response regulator [Microcella sp.]MBX9473056.1 response regulator [Microcella sp.]